jgi:hypothetical protein
MLRKPKLAAFFVLLAVTSSAHAQYPGPGVWITPYILNPCADGRCDPKPEGSPTQKDDEGAGVSANPPQVLAPSLSYTPSASRSKTNLQTFIAGANNGGALIATLSAQHDLLAMMRKGLSAKGLSSDNLAHAYAVYLISAWQALRGDTAQRTNAEYKAVAAQAMTVMSENPVVQADDAQKQAMAEEFLLLALVMDVANNQLQGDKEQLTQLRERIKQGLKEGFLTKTMLTDEGFVAVSDGEGI